MYITLLYSISSLSFSKSLFDFKKTNFSQIFPKDLPKVLRRFSKYFPNIFPNISQIFFQKIPLNIFPNSSKRFLQISPEGFPIVSDKSFRRHFLHQKEDILLFLFEKHRHTRPFWVSGLECCFSIYSHSTGQGRSAEKNAKFGWTQFFESPDKVGVLPVLESATARKCFVKLVCRILYLTGNFCHFISSQTLNISCSFQFMLRWDSCQRI